MFLSGPLFQFPSVAECCLGVNAEGVLPQKGKWEVNVTRWQGGLVVGQARGRGTESQTKPRLLCSNITSTLKIRDFLCLAQLLSRNPTECHRARYSTVKHQAVNHQDPLVPRTALLAHGKTRHLRRLSRCFTR